MGEGRRSKKGAAKETQRPEIVAAVAEIEEVLVRLEEEVAAKKDEVDPMAEIVHHSALAR